MSTNLRGNDSLKRYKSRSMRGETTPVMFIQQIEFQFFRKNSKNLFSMANYVNACIRKAAFKFVKI